MPDKETFFTNAERSLIAKFMLDRTAYVSPDDKLQVRLGKYRRRRIVIGSCLQLTTRLSVCKRKSVVYSSMPN